ncbi:MAG: cellulase family glycosylhydrolase [Acidobacteria bacterium]|nr:cellulase family glycosylhydrolase [Acidobacteriota bacterium]
MKLTATPQVLLLGVLFAWTPAATAEQPTIPEGTPNGFSVRRGTNISHWLSQSRRRGEERARFFTVEDMTLIARLGYDHVRLPVDEEQLWDESGAPEEEAFGLLDSALDWAAARGLPVIVDLHILRSHHFNEGDKPLWTDPKAQDRFVEIWRQLSDRLKTRPNDRVAYELMNEAVADDPEEWNVLLARAVEALREREPERTLVIGSNRWQQVETFDQLRIPEGDPNILLSFHLYTPMALTHYGASWTKVGEYGGPVRYPGEVVTEDDLAGLPQDLAGAIRDGRGLYFDRTVLEEKLAKPLALARRAKLPLYCGEWGALPGAPRADRLRWYRDFRSVLERNGIGWAHWDYKGGFGVVDGERNVHVDLAHALLGEDVSLAPIPSTALGIFQGESEVGTVRLPGATVFDQGRREYRVTGGGENIWGAADAFHYAWQEIAGDVDLSATVRFVGSGKQAHRKAGLMVRASLDAAAPYVNGTVHGDGLVSLQYRETRGGETQEVKASLTAVPVSLRLTRRGDLFTLFVARPGEPLEEAGSVTVSLEPEVYVGLAVCSHETGRLETAVFSDLEVTVPAR